MTQLIQQFCRVFGLMQGCGILRKGRNMKKRNWFLTGACTLASAAMMSAAVFGASYTPGTYEAAAAGRNGDVKVEVTFTEDAIESVNVTEHAETDGIGTTAVETLPGAIVDNQSLGVDVVAGATITSEAILAAAADCVTQAGGDAEALKAATVEEKEPELQEELDADLVIIGGIVRGYQDAGYHLTNFLCRFFNIGQAELAECWDYYLQYINSDLTVFAFSLSGRMLNIGSDSSSPSSGTMNRPIAVSSFELQ